MPLELQMGGNLTAAGILDNGHHTLQNTLKILLRFFMVQASRKDLSLNITYMFWLTVKYQMRPNKIA